MSDLISRTARLVPYAKRPKHIASFVTAYLYEPGAADASFWLGNIYVVIEVLVSGRASEEIVDLIIETAGDKYYNESPEVTSPLSRFEGAIKQVNQALAEHVGRGNAAWIGKLSAIIAVQTNYELHVAQTGSAEAFLYRGKAVSRISLTETNRPATPSKTFGSIATGELEAGDKLLIATPALIHQVPLAKLQSVITSCSPNAAIAEISQLLDGIITNRIAALVVEITTPEIAALKVRSEEPPEIQLGNGENLAETALRAAVPLAQTTAETSQKVALAAQSTYQQLKPKFRRGSLRIIDIIRQFLSTKRGRKTFVIILVIILLFLIILIFQSGSNAGRTKTINSYQNLFREYTAAQQSSNVGNKESARNSLVKISQSLTSIHNQTEINSDLSNIPLLQGEPTTVQAFKTLVSDQIDKIDGLIKVNPMTVADIGGKNSKPLHFESDGSHAYVIDSSNQSKISIVNLLTGIQKDSNVDASKLGDVVSTTLSTAGDGMFILTSKPSVWFYRFANDSISEQTISYDTWPKSLAIASYGSNLYLLGSDIIYKHVRNATGFSPRSIYISTTQGGKNASAITVDGWVYTITDSGLNRYVSSKLKLTAQYPSSLGTLANLRSTAGGNTLIATSTTSSRLAIWSSTNTALTFDKQILLQGDKSVHDATYDQQLGKIFATVDNRLVSFPINF